MFRRSVWSCFCALVLASTCKAQATVPVSSGMTRGAGDAKVPVSGELPELATDRPDFTEVTETVRPGVVQVEMGFTLDREGGVRHLSQGEILSRIGLTPRLELRLGGEGLLSERGSGSAWHRGVSDTEVGFKLSLWEQKKMRPALSLIPMLSMPSGSRAFTSSTFDPTLKMVLSEDLPVGFTLGGNLNFSSISGDTHRITQEAWSLSLGHDLTRGFGAYWEAFSIGPWEPGSSPAYLINSGVTHGLGRNAQIDFRGGQRLTDVGPNWFFGVGFAFRQPTHLLPHW